MPWLFRTKRGEIKAEAGSFLLIVVDNEFSYGYVFSSTTYTYNKHKRLGMAYGWAIANTTSASVIGMLEEPLDKIQDILA